MVDVGANRTALQITKWDGTLACHRQAFLCPAGQAVLVNLDVFRREAVCEQVARGVAAQPAHIAGTLAALIKDDAPVSRQGRTALLDFIRRHIDGVGYVTCAKFSG